MKMEHRSFQGLEVRNDEESRTIGGIAVPYNEWSEDLGFFERFAPGSLTDTLRETDLRVIFNHNADYVVGRVSAGTARFSDTDQGLKYEADAPNAVWADGLLESIRRGDIRENSFGFMTVEDTWEERDGRLYRTVLKAELREVGPQTFPAYSQSTVDVRSVLQRGMEAVRRGRFPEVERLRLEVEGIL